MTFEQLTEISVRKLKNINEYILDQLEHSYIKLIDIIVLKLNELES